MIVQVIVSPKRTVNDSDCPFKDHPVKVILPLPFTVMKPTATQRKQRK